MTRKAIRGHPAILLLLGERAYCARRQCARLSFARVHRTLARLGPCRVYATLAQRNYRETLSKQESIRHAPRSRTGRDGMPIANRVRSLALADRERTEQKRTQRDAAKR